MLYPKSIQNLIDRFNKLPGLGPKTSERFVFYLLSRPKQEIDNFIKALSELQKSTVRCEICYAFSEKNPCEICRNKNRNHNLICVVAKDADILPIEKTKAFDGIYHVLGGVINPIKKIAPENLRIKELAERLQTANGGINEIILALNPDMEGETTSLYLKKILASYKTKITRLARGLPTGAEVEYADEITLADALRGRREI